MKSVKKMTVSPRKGTTGTITKKDDYKDCELQLVHGEDTSQNAAARGKGGKFREEHQRPFGKEFREKDTFRRDRSPGSPEEQSKRTSEQPR